MNLLQALVLAIVEGITEFLPISSTGHMILAADVLKIAQSEFVKSFEIAIQVGAIGAVAWEMRKTIKSLKTLTTIAVAFVPTGVIGFLVYKLVKTYLLGNLAVVAWSLVIGGVGMLVFEKIYDLRFRNHDLKIENLGWKRAVVIGLLQSVSVIPGVSRALVTVVGGMSVGLSREEAVKMSFLLAVPTMLAATGYDLIRSGWDFSVQEWQVLIIGILVAFVFAYLTVKWLIGYVRKHNFVGFGIYRIVMGIIYLWRL